MGASIYPRFEHEVPGVKSTDVGGKVLSRHLERLDEVAQAKGLRPLADFIYLSAADLEDLIGGDDADEEKLARAREDMARKAEAKLDPETVAELGRMEVELEQSWQQMQKAMDEALANPGPPPPEWFEPNEALPTVRALLTSLRDEPDDLPDVTWLLEDLQALERSLAAAQAQGVRFRLSVDT